MAVHYVISVMAKDRVGIIADVATAVKNLDGNLADMSQTVLCGYFTMILLASFPDCVDPETIRATLARCQGTTPFEVGIQQVDGNVVPEPTVRQDNQYVLTAAGPDQIGLVAAVAEYLRQKGINVEDLATVVDQGTYTMVLLLDLPPGTDVAKLKHSLRIGMEDVGVTVELQHHGIFRTTNEI